MVNRRTEVRAELLHFEQSESVDDRSQNLSCDSRVESLGFSQNSDSLEHPLFPGAVDHSHVSGALVMDDLAHQPRPLGEQGYEPTVDLVDTPPYCFEVRLDGISVIHSPHHRAVAVSGG